MTKQTILIGETKDSIIEIELELEQNYRKPNEYYLSLCGNEYDKNLFTEEDGERQAREYLEDGELWRMSVEADQTTLGLDDWVELVLNTDGWEQTLGDIYEILDLGMYTRLSSCGQIDMHVKAKHFVKTYIPNLAVKEIWRIWKKYHMKQLNEIPKQIIEEIKTIFEKHTSDISQLKQFADVCEECDSIDVDKEYSDAYYFRCNGCGAEWNKPNKEITKL